MVQDPLFSLSSFCSTFSLLLSPHKCSSTLKTMHPEAKEGEEDES